MSGPEAAANHAQDEERLSRALVSRGLLTREEAQQCRQADPAGGKGNPQSLLARLVKAGFLTANQARRVAQELPTLLATQIPGYQLLEKLGQGAMGTVYKARQVSMDRLVAIKLLSPKLAANPDYLQRFVREAHVAAKLSHNNIVQAIDVGSAGAVHYFIMEFVEGTTIQRELDAGKVYDEREAVDLVLQVAQALAHANRRGLVHRDIKPANIILTQERIAKLADLGLARQREDKTTAQSEKGMVYGTPYYISPEQIQGLEDVDCRSDIYSLGATFYHMVTGKRPFTGKTVLEMFNAHLNEELVPPDHVNTRLSSGVGEVVEFMMAKEREQRYRTPEDLILDLECLLSGQPPKLARQRIEAATLKGLASGDEEDGGDDRGGRRKGRRRAQESPWLWALGGCLAVSVLLNVLLVVLRR